MTAPPELQPRDHYQDLTVGIVAIRRRLFQDVYDRAGQGRTVEIAKGGQAFQFRQHGKAGISIFDLASSVSALIGSSL
jgi:hypothetical protein